MNKDLMKILSVIFLVLLSSSISWSGERKFMELKRNSIWLTKNIQSSTDIRIKISRAKNLDELRDIFEQIFDN